MKKFTFLITVLTLFISSGSLLAQTKTFVAPPDTYSFGTSQEFLAFGDDFTCSLDENILLPLDISINTTNANGSADILIARGTGGILYGTGVVAGGSDFALGLGSDITSGSQIDDSTLSTQGGDEISITGFEFAYQLTNAAGNSTDDRTFTITGKRDGATVGIKIIGGTSSHATLINVDLTTGLTDLPGSIPSFFTDIDELLIEPSAPIFGGWAIDDLVIEDSSTRNTWIGGGTDWFTGSNWSLGTVPTSSQQILIPSQINNTGLTYPTMDSDVTINSLHLNPTISSDIPDLEIEPNVNLLITGNLFINTDAILTLNSSSSGNSTLITQGTSEGQITYNRYINSGWHTISAPVSNVTHLSLEPQLAQNISLRALGTYLNYGPTRGDKPDYEYMTVGQGGSMVSGIGNAAALPGFAAGTLAMKGYYNSSNVSPTISIGNKDYYNLVGNPYTAYINSKTLMEDADNALEAANFTIWIYDSGVGFVLHNLANEVNIAPGQGFFVRSTNASGTFRFKTSMQNQLGGNTFKKQAANTFIELSMENNTIIKSTKVFYIENKTTGFDNGYDSRIFKSEDFALFTELVDNNDGRKLGIQTLPKTDFENMIVPIGVNAEAGKEIKFSLNTTNFDANLKVFLEDKETNTFTRLDEANSNHTITTTSPLTGSGRFYLHTSQAALSQDSDLNISNTSIYKLNNTTLKIAGLPQGTSNFAMYNMLGKKVMYTTFASNSVKELALPKLAAGVYLVQLETANGKLNKKIILE